MKIPPDSASGLAVRPAFVIHYFEVFNYVILRNVAPVSVAARARVNKNIFRYNKLYRQKFAL